MNKDRFLGKQISGGISLALGFVMLGGMVQDGKPSESGENVAGVPGSVFWEYADEPTLTKGLTITSGEVTRAPNIIFMMADDIGYNDLACYGQRVFPTPHTDRLAEQGISLTSAYSPSSVCSPTRYAVLTGTDPFRRYITSHVLFNAEPLVVGKGEETVASLLKQAGYATGAVGKWHLGLGDALPRDLNTPGRGPNEIGFDYSFLVPDGNNMLPHVYHENGFVVADEGTRYDSELVIQERIGLSLLQHNPNGRWENHRPGNEIGATLADRVDAFIGQHHDRPFFLYYATCAVHTPHTPDQRFLGKSGLGNFGDFVMEFDWAVGRVMARLDELGLTENTLLIVTSDNGGLPFNSTRVPEDVHRTCDPWRGYKGQSYEGGHRVPFIARWPGQIEAGAQHDAYLSLVDLFATAASLAGLDMPPASARDSYDMMPVLKGGASIRPYVVTGDRGMSLMAIRRDEWKLITCPLDMAGAELYNLVTDPMEITNVADNNPAIIGELWGLLQEYANTGRSRPGAEIRPAPYKEVLAQREKRNQEVDSLFRLSEGGGSRRKN